MLISLFDFERWRTFLKPSALLDDQPEAANSLLTVSRRDLPMRDWLMIPKILRVRKYSYSISIAADDTTHQVEVHQ